jgi:ATP-dependent Lon protease
MSSEVPSECSDGHVPKRLKRLHYVENVAIDKMVYGPEEIRYYCEMSRSEQSGVAETELLLTTASEDDDVPMRFRILGMKIRNDDKRRLLKHLYSLNTDRKRIEQLETILRVPYGVLIDPFANRAPREVIEGLRRDMDAAVMGHDVTKRHIMRLVAQWMTSTRRCGLVLGIHGPAGVGKTALVERGIAKALGLPYNHINLCGVSDAAYLHGHDYTYQGSGPGRIVKGLMVSGCMNPVFFFDELDKVSATAKGDEIVQALMFLTDPAQNHRFNDIYVGDHDIDLSQAVFVFSFNDRRRVDPILLDRMTVVETPGYDRAEKAAILQKHAAPEVLSRFERLSPSARASLASPAFIGKVVDMCQDDVGMRSCIRLFRDTCAEINVCNILGTAAACPHAVLQDERDRTRSPMDTSLGMMYT